MTRSPNGNPGREGDQAEVTGQVLNPLAPTFVPATSLSSDETLLKFPATLQSNGEETYVKAQVPKQPPAQSKKRLSGHSERTEPSTSPDGFKGCQTDVSACDTHSNHDQSVKRPIRSRNKLAFLGDYICSIKTGPVSPKKKPREQKTSYTKKRVGKKLFSTSGSCLTSEGLSQLASYCSYLLPDEYTSYDSGQTETKLTNDPVLTNTQNTVDCVNANESVSGCRSFVMSGQHRCEFCHEILVSENSARRHLLLHHR